MQYQFFTIAPELSIPEVTLYGIKFADEAFDILTARSDRK